MLAAGHRRHGRQRRSRRLDLERVPGYTASMMFWTTLVGKLNVAEPTP